MKCSFYTKLVSQKYTNDSCSVCSACCWFSSSTTDEPSLFTEFQCTQVTTFWALAWFVIYRLWFTTCILWAICCPYPMIGLCVLCPCRIFGVIIIISCLLINGSTCWVGSSNAWSVILLMLNGWLGSFWGRPWQYLICMWINNRYLMTMVGYFLIFKKSCLPLNRYWLI